ncbi:hypothetical protein GCM10010245_90940 [Streptomyces spectabilis]|nr:hypothetical protein GCM10010245_90940 [Streptomyces spectabilis]
MPSVYIITAKAVGVNVRRCARETTIATAHGKVRRSATNAPTNPPTAAAPIGSPVSSPLWRLQNVLANPMATHMIAITTSALSGKRRACAECCDPIRDAGFGLTLYTETPILEPV